MNCIKTVPENSKKSAIFIKSSYLYFGPIDPFLIVYVILQFAFTRMQISECNSRKITLGIRNRQRAEWEKFLIDFALADMTSAWQRSLRIHNQFKCTGKRNWQFVRRLYEWLHCSRKVSFRFMILVWKGYIFIPRNTTILSLYSFVSKHFNYFRSLFMLILKKNLWKFFKNFIGLI